MHGIFVSRFKSLHLILRLYLCGLIVLFLGLWRERDGVSESSESDWFYHSCHLCFGYSSQKAITKGKNKRNLFFKIVFIKVKERYKLRSVFKAK